MQPELVRLRDENLHLRALLRNASTFGSWGGKRAKLRPEELGPRQEEVLSYLIGLAPIGTPVEISRRTLMLDLGFNNPQPYYQAMAKLIAYGFIRRIGCGRGGTTGVFVVLRRFG